MHLRQPDWQNLRSFDYDISTAADGMNWYVYIILCSDESLYTGITVDPERRFSQHAAGKGAKYFRGRLPIRIVYLEGGHSRSTAGKREAQIKLASRAEKVLLIAAGRQQPV